MQSVVRVQQGTNEISASRNVTWASDISQTVDVTKKTEVSSDSQSLGDTAACEVCINTNTPFETVTRNGLIEMA
jgi:hypothetical protein